MGKNKIENFIFTAIVCFLMVFGMSAYNSILKHGFSSSFIAGFLVPLFPVFFIALALDWFLVGPVAKGLVKKIVNNNTAFIKKILLISLFMVLGMSMSMSFIATIVGHGIDSSFYSLFAKTELKNFACALPLQLFFVGPMARFIFFKIFPNKDFVAQNS